MEYLKMSNGNAKLGSHIVVFNIPSGYSCPFAKDCKSKAVVNKKTGKVKVVDGKDTVFRCYAASQEALLPSVRKARQYNFDLLKGLSTDEMANLIEKSIYKRGYFDMPTFRIHASGDFFNQDYFDAWMLVAKKFPDAIFYAYTKSLKYWVARLDSIPANVRLNASKGGRNDELIAKHDLKFAEVVYSEAEAKIKGLKIDKTDKMAYNQAFPFALIIHGTQPKGSEAGKTLQVLKKNGFFGYSKK